MTQRDKALNIISKYIKSEIEKGNNFVFAISGRVHHDGKDWSIFGAADCNTMPEHMGRLFLRLQRINGYYTQETEVWLDLLDVDDLEDIIARTWRCCSPFKKMYPHLAKSYETGYYSLEQAEADAKENGYTDVGEYLAYWFRETEPHEYTFEEQGPGYGFNGTRLYEDDSLVIKDIYGQVMFDGKILPKE